MQSDLPKVLQTLAGRPLIDHVVATAHSIPNANLHMVVGHQAELVKEVLADDTINFIHQDIQLGTGHAVQMALPHLQEYGISIILYGDVPLITATTLRELCTLVDEQSMALLTMDVDDPHGYGRIIRNNDEDIIAIVEQRDCNAQQNAVNEINTGILAVRNEDLIRWLPKLTNYNDQGEFYLTDIVALAVADNKQVLSTEPMVSWEVLGVNDRAQLAQVERIYQEQHALKLLNSGVRLVDPTRIDIRGQLDTGRDVSIDVNCVFEGLVSLGDGVIIESHCVLKDCQIESGTIIKAFSHIEQATISDNCTIGPYARLRPGTVLQANAKIGNFVETKNALIGQGSKVNHLSYIGDASLGEEVNVGAGTITCNYDGANKHKTTIEDNAFIGSNTALVAPVTVKSGATVGAGSTVTTDVKADSLVVTRARKIEHENWPRPKKKSTD
jgi:bifunctional UDP-N-acetylglucosamine pyrophosphorylase/glucosamine-1-phosphate N-acetyltransferase